MTIFVINPPLLLNKQEKDKKFTHLKTLTTNNKKKQAMHLEVYKAV